LDELGQYGAPERYAVDGNVPVALLGELVIDLASGFV